MPRERIEKCAMGHAVRRLLPLDREDYGEGLLEHVDLQDRTSRIKAEIVESYVVALCLRGLKPKSHPFLPICVASVDKTDQCRLGYTSTGGNE